MFSDIRKIMGLPPKENPLKPEQGRGRERPDPDARRRKGTSSDESLSVFEDDQATVTLEALQLYLQSLIQQDPQRDRAQKLAALEDELDHKIIKPQTEKPKAFQAAKLYARNADQQSRDQARPTVQKPHVDQGRIQTMLKQIIQMQEQGYTEMHIPQGNDFINSIEIALQSINPQRN